MIVRLGYCIAGFLERRERDDSLDFCHFARVIIRIGLIFTCISVGVEGIHKTNSKENVEQPDGYINHCKFVFSSVPNPPFHENSSSHLIIHGTLVGSA